MSHDSFKTDLDRLSSEQKAVVNSWGKGLAVIAGAGSGKTTTLVVKCIELLRKNPQAKIVAVSFTEKSASDLRAKFTEKIYENFGEKAREILQRQKVLTIHGLCGSILRDFPLPAGVEGEESILSEAEGSLLWEQALDALWYSDLPESVNLALHFMLGRESRDALADLLKRVRELKSFQVLNFLDGNEATLALKTLASYVLTRYQELKLRRGVLDFQDLELAADRALREPSVRESYQKKFDLFLVDEFQDTNPLQADILWRLVKPDLSNLCVVGDPKQSIYRFRDADVSVFEEYCQKLPETYALTLNFRSRPGIIDYVNQICAPIFAASQMPFETLTPNREESPESLIPVLRLNVREPSELARFILSEKAKGLELSEMALLLRKIRGNEKWLKALSAAGIPLAIGSGGLFWEDARVRELVSFLKWWDNPQNALSGGVFFRAPWVRKTGLNIPNQPKKIDDRELDDWVKTDPTWQKPFFNSPSPLAQKLKSFRGRKVSPSELLLSFLDFPEIEQELGAQLLGLWHRAEELSSRGLDFHAVVLELDAARTENRREREVPPPKNLGQLPVLSLHSAKGLEFAHVILLDFSGPTRAANSPLLFWDRREGAYLATRDEEGEREKNHPQEIIWREQERFKNISESKRLFYVALTRAQERLVLVCPEVPSRKESEDSSYVKDDWRGWIEEGGVEVPLALAPENLSKIPGKNWDEVFSPSLPRTPAPASGLKRSRHSVTEWALLEKCERAYEWKFIRPPEAKESFNEEVPALFPGLTTRELGTRVHACLEAKDFLELKNLEIEAGSSRISADKITAWANTSPLMDNDGPVWAELNFEIPVAGEILVGSIDRLVENERGLTLIDFKVTAREKTSNELIKTYQTQMDLYAWALFKLEPALTPEKILARIVHISPQGVQEVDVPYHPRKIENIAVKAGEIVNGKVGRPQAGAHCGVCDFKNHCPDSATALTGKTSL